MAPTATNHGPQAADGPPAILEPERPRRRRSNPNPATDPTAATEPGVRSPTPRGPAGCRPTTSSVNGLSFCGGPLGFPLSAPAPGQQA